MAQHDYVIANGTGAAVRSDLNGGLAAIVSQNSGATAPSTTYAYQSWADISAGVMKMRNGANNAWISLYELDGTFLAGDISLSGGAVATPSLFFTGDTNTGIYSPGADQLAISTGGTSRLAVSTTAVSSTLAVDHPLGAVGTPSITFTGDLNTGIWSPAVDTIAFSEGGAEAMRIDSSGRLLVGTTTANTSGGILQLSSGLTFPATQVASTDPNTLDDYEEGTFTPTIVGVTLAGTGTYSIQAGRYTKTGNRVNFSVYMVWSAHTGTGEMQVAAMPFASSSATDVLHAVSIWQQNITLTASNVMMGYFLGGNTRIALSQTPTGGGAQAAVPMDVSGVLMVTGVYEV